MDLRNVIRLALVLAAPAAISLTAAPGAHAHAVLLGTVPAPQALVAHAPHQVQLTFSENVSLTLGGVEVFDPAGRPVVEGPAVAAGPRVSVPIASEAQGTHAVSWRVISADGHPVRGAFAFSAGRQTASSATAKAFAAAETDRALSISFGVVRFGYLAAILLATGAAVFAAVVAPRWAPRVIRRALVAVIAFSVAGFFLQAAIAADVSLGDTFDGGLIEDQLSTLYGNGAVVRVVLAALGLVMLALARPLEEAQRPARLAIAAVLVALACAQSLSGHAMATSPVGLRLPLDMLHVVAAAAWLGGLVQLHAYVSRHRPDAAVVVRYSRLALSCVIVLVLTGTYAALAESDVSLRALVETDYGLVLGIKLGLFVLTMPIANVNRTRNVPAIVAGAADAPQRLRRYVRMEMVILVAVVGLTAGLIETVPARHARHQVEAPPGPFSETRALPSGARATLALAPAAPGPNQVTVTVRTRAGAPDAAVAEIELTGSLTERKLDRLPIALKRAAPGRWTARGRSLPLPGKWRFEVSVRRGEFEQERTTFEAQIGAAQP